MRLRKTALFMLIGLLLVVFAAAMAKTPAQGDQKTKSEASCSMDSCCCNGGSCPMKEEGAAGADAKESCCCCSDDSCALKTNDTAKNHSDHEGCCCCGDSCDQKKHDAKNHGNKSDCCNMKHKHTKTKAKQKAA